ncbi:MAG TPA: helix-turn-helix transcriptional regulator [Pseudogracilibacillus sp.]|nr:helix-turn-helix transcriptional regulator [Pseudogracilibacillus sp.]
MEDKKYKELQNTFGKIMFEHRRIIKNYSHEKLASLTGMDANNLTRIERGEQLPETVTLFKVSDALGIDLTENLSIFIESINNDENDWS